MAAVAFDTPGDHDWEVPDEVTAVTVTMWGGQRRFDGNKATHPVTPGETLRVVVGGGARYVTDSATPPGPGHNGGGTGQVLNSVAVDDVWLHFTTHGAGASDLRQGGTATGDRIQVNGGAGGRSVVASDDPAYDSGGGYGFYELPAEAGTDLEVAAVSGSGATGGTSSGLSYPRAGSYPVGGPYTPAGTSYPGAGGGGYVGGDTGEVWLDAADLYERWFPTRGQAGADHVAGTGSPIGQYSTSGFTFWWSRGEPADTTDVDGLVIVEYLTPPPAETPDWALGHVRLGGTT